MLLQVNFLDFPVRCRSAFRTLNTNTEYQCFVISLALFYSGVDKRILVWDLAEGTLLTELKGHTDTVYSMRFSRDGNMLASGRYDHSLSRA